jgi:hypothetical protein
MHVTQRLHSQTVTTEHCGSLYKCREKVLLRPEFDSQCDQACDGTRQPLFFCVLHDLLLRSHWTKWSRQNVRHPRAKVRCSGPRDRLFLAAVPRKCKQTRLDDPTWDLPSLPSETTSIYHGCPLRPCNSCIIRFHPSICEHLLQLRPVSGRSYGCRPSIRWVSFFGKEMPSVGGLIG